MKYRLQVWAAGKSWIGNVGVGILALTVAACGGGGGAEPTALPPVVVPDQPTVVFPTLIPIQPGPTLTPTPVLVEEEPLLLLGGGTPVPTPPPVWEGTVKAAGLRFRSAPDIRTGAVLANLSLHSTLYIYGRNADGTWLHVAREADDSARGWVFASYVDWEGGMEQLPERGVEEVAVEPTAAAVDPEPNLSESPAVAQFFIEALAVPLQNSALQETPNGKTMATVPKGKFVTALARSADEQWLAVYTSDLEERQYGWIAKDTVRLYGGENLPSTSSDAPWLELPPG